MSLVDGRFTLEKKLGAGGFGEAHLARDVDGSRVVVKLLHARLANVERASERFRREITALERLRHPHVVSLVASGFCPALQQPYYAMEWSPGEPLDKILANGRMPFVRAAKLVDQLLSALETAHALGIVHRDVKPANLLVEDGTAAGDVLRVLDFGMAKHLRGGAQTIEDLTRGQPVGSPLYMSPEQVHGATTTAKTDIYAVGCILMELLTGSPPFKSETLLGLFAQHSASAPPRLDEREPGSKPALVALVAACLEKDPDDRPDATTLQRRLREIAGIESAVPGGAASLARKASDPQQRSIGSAETVRRSVEGKTSYFPPPQAAPRSEDQIATGERPAPGKGVAGVEPSRTVRPVAGARLGAYMLEEAIASPDKLLFRTRLANGSPALVEARLPDGDGLAVRRFAREVRLRRVLEHPAFPAIHDIGNEGGVPFAVTELVQGEDLSVRLLRDHRLTIEKLLPILRHIVPGLDFAHARGIVHCDLKPANIRIRTDGRAYLLGFADAKIRERARPGGEQFQTAEGTTIGTAAYMAPELAEGRDGISPMVDVYSLGVVLYEALSGRLPFLVENGKLIAPHERAKPPDLKRLAPWTSTAVCDAVMRCIEEGPRDRFVTAGFLLRALEEAVASGGALDKSAGPVARPPALAATVDVPPPVALSPTIDVPPPVVAFAPCPDAAPVHDLALALAVLSGESAGLVQILEGRNGELVLGRDPEAFIVFASGDGAVSRRHAALEVRANGVSIRDLGSAGGTFVEGAVVGPEGLPVARGAGIRLGEPGVLLVVDQVEQLQRASVSPPVLRRLDREGPQVCLDRPRTLGRSSKAEPGLDRKKDALASALHCRVSPRLGHVVVEDLESANGTFRNGERVAVAILRAGDELALGGKIGPRYVLEMASGDVPSAGAAGPSEPLAFSGDALRAKLDVSGAGKRARVFIFSGTHLRFGRNVGREGRTVNDLVLRAFPRPNEEAKAAKKRTRAISGHHGTFLVTNDGIAVRDDGSTLGTTLDGVALVPHRATPLPNEFMLEVAKVLRLEGRVFRKAGGPHAAVNALRLRRCGDGEEHSYVLVVGEATVGCGPDDAVYAPDGHARIALRAGRFAIGVGRKRARVVVSKRELDPGRLVTLKPGDVITLGAASLHYALASAEDMKP